MHVLGRRTLPILAFGFAVLPPAHSSPPVHNDKPLVWVATVPAIPPRGMWTLSASHRQALRLLLEARRNHLHSRLDSLEGDTSRILDSKRRRFLAALASAVSISEEAGARLGEMRNQEDEPDPRKWRKARARTERLLESLDRFFPYMEAFLSRTPA